MSDTTAITKPAEPSTARPAAKSTTKSAAKPAAKPAAKSTTKSASKSTTEPAPRSTPKPAPKPPSKKAGLADGVEAAANILQRIADLVDWRGAMLARVRALIVDADPAIVEEWKWNLPVWSCDGIVCTGEVYKTAVKLTFAHGAAVDDPAGLFNASLDGNTRRAIDFSQGHEIDERALKTLIRAAVDFNRARSNKKAAKKAPAKKQA